MTATRQRLAHSETRRARRVLFIALTVTPVLGALFAPGLEAGIAYIVATIAVLVPSVQWISAGAPGIPIWPAVAILSWLYYVLPILRDKAADQESSSAVLFLGITVAAYLILGSIPWRMMLPPVMGEAQPQTDKTSAEQMLPLIFLGLGSGIAFRLLASLGLFDSLGPLFGFVRSLMLTGPIVSCYVLGYARGRRVLRGQRWALAVVILVANVLVAWSALFLVGGVSYLLAAIGGYVITTKRIPWAPLVVTAATLTVLHAGKAEMRRQYWALDSNSGLELTRVEDVPSVIAQWFEAGIASLTSGEENSTIVDRASLFRQLLSVQQLAPERVAFVGGETYALLPQLLIPRFLAPDKITSQTGMTILNVHFGFQTYQQAQVTSIGWGLISEGYANFGFVGVLAIGLVAGTIAGCFSRWTCGAQPISLSMFLGIVTLMTMTNLETDLSYLLTNLWQSCISIGLLWAGWRLVRSRSGRGMSGSGAAYRPTCS